MPIIFQIILFLFFIVFAWISNKNAKLGIYCVIFSLPWYLVRFSLLGIPTTVLEMMIYVLFAAWFLKNRNNLKIYEGVKNFFRNDKILFCGIVLLFLGVILSTLHSINLRTSLGIVKGWFFDPFLFFIIFISEIKGKKQAANAFLSFILSSFVVALISLFYALNGIFTFDGRLRAFYESPNYLAMYLAPGFLFAVYFSVMCHPKIFKGDTWGSCAKPAEICDNEKNKTYFAWPRDPGYLLCKFRDDIWRGSITALTLAGGILICFMIVLFLTKSYGAFLGIVVALAVLLAKKCKNKKILSNKSTKSKIIIFFMAAFLIFSFVSCQKYWQIINSNERSSFHSRLMIWNASLEMLKNNPIFGIGPGTFQEVYLDYQNRFSVPYLEWAVAEPHNTFLAFYLESGLLGFIGFILILLWLYKKSKMNDIVFLFLAYFLIHGLVDTLYWKNDLSAIFWIIIAAGFVL